MELHQCLGWVESQSETPILGVLSALLRNFYWYCPLSRPVVLYEYARSS
jgi:hypothetical protein